MAQAAAELAAAAGPALPGTLTVRSYACGKRRCRCHDDPPQLHGPYWQWTRKRRQDRHRRLVPETRSPPGSPCSTTTAGCASCSPRWKTSPYRPRER